MRSKLNFLFLLIPFLLLASTDDRALYIQKYSSESKTALVIGNGTYKYFSHLNNAINDANDMKDLLESKGFKVHYLKNATHIEMDKKVDKFIEDLEKGGVGMLYYAGHGVEVDGKNYLIPIDMGKSTKIDIKYDALAINEVIEKMENARNRLNILVLDACRNDPYSRSGGGGLAAINNARGMYVAYATGPGEVASDGSGSNGLFTKHLINEIKKAQTLEKVFKNTRSQVYNESNHKQIPWTSSSVMGEFYFTIPVDGITPQPKREEYPQSTFSFDNVAATTFSLTINPTPSSAVVQIVNIEDKYYDGIKLKKGTYKIKVSKSGYITKQGNINLQSNTTIPVSLEKKQVAYTISDIPIDKGSYIMPAMVAINSGSFMMGSNDGRSNEKPIHKVTIDYNFYIGKYEVTVGEFKKFVKDTNYKTDAHKNRYCYTYTTKWEKKNGANYLNPGFKQSDNSPAVCVSWNDATAYTKWLSSKTNKTYRLPSESEWEYVARAGTTTKYSFDSSDNSLDTYGWYTSNSGNTTHQVGQNQPNPWGLYDIHGNVWEWCQDWYMKSYFSTPTDGSSYNNKQDYKVLRGGSWYDYPTYLRSAIRYKNNPDIMVDTYGFRLLLEQ